MVEKYLKRCIRSIQKQTYKNLEIILVDDGGTDNCSRICDEFAQKDSRIKVVHKQNGGLSDARNVGIDIARGEYITFVDSDDYVTQDYIEYLYNLLEKNKADISIVSNKKTWKFSDTVDLVNNKEILFSNVDAVEDLLYQKHIENSAWAKLYKTELFSDIRYPIGMLYEDLGTTYKLLFKATNIVWSNEQKYFYFQRDNSIMNKKFSGKNLDRIFLSQEILNFVDKKIPKIKNAAESRFFVSNIQVLRELPLKESCYFEIRDEIKKNIKIYRKKVLFDSNAKKMTRCIAAFSYLPIWFLKDLGKFYNFRKK